MGCTFYLESKIEQRDEQGREPCDIRILDNHGRIELRVGPTGVGDTAETYCLSPTIAQVDEMIDALDSLRSRLLKHHP